jgi:CBS domain-containing protein
MVVADLVKEDVVVVRADATVGEAAALLARAHVSGAPVLEGDHVVGVVTMGDLRRWTAATDSTDLDPVARSRWSGPGSLERLRLADLLGRVPVIAHLDWPLARALEALEVARVQRLPVLDAAGHLVGVVSREALLAAVRAAGPTDARQANDRPR